jgi:hypothetical protein
MPQLQTGHNWPKVVAETAEPKCTFHAQRFDSLRPKGNSELNRKAFAVAMPAFGAVL